MSKIVLADTNGGFNLSTINQNFQLIEEVLNDEVLFRVNTPGEANEIHQTLDMNGNRIINLPKPVGLSEPLRLQDVIDINSGEFVVPTAASQITVNPTGGVTATDVQSALVELSTEAATEVTNRQTADTTILTEVHRKENLVNSIASLRLVDKTIYSSVYVVSYYAGIIGGDGHYSYDPTDTTSADNGGTVIVAADGGRWKLFSNNRISVKNFGAKGDNTANDTTAMQAAHNTGKVIYYPAGIYHFTLLTISAGGMVGDGEGQSILVSSDVTAANVITYSADNNSTGAGTPRFENITLEGSLSKTQGAGVIITAPTTENDGGRFLNFTIIQFPICLDLTRAALWTIQTCSFGNYNVAGVRVNNLFVPDSGDSVIQGCSFATAFSTAVGIFYNGSGGLKVIGNKINNGGFGILLDITAAASTSIFVISGNSIENQSVAAIQFARTTGSSTFSLIMITGNELGINKNGIIFDTSGAFAGVTITGNLITLNGSNSGTALIIGTLSSFTVVGNVLIGAAGTTGVTIAATSSNGVVGANVFNGFTTNLTNASASVSVMVVP